MLKVRLRLDTDYFDPRDLEDYRYVGKIFLKVGSKEEVLYTTTPKDNEYAAMDAIEEKVIEFFKNTFRD